MQYQFSFHLLSTWTDGNLRTIHVGLGKHAQKTIFLCNWGTFIISTFGFCNKWKICANISQLLLHMIVVVFRGIYCVHSDIIFPYSFVQRLPFSIQFQRIQFASNQNNNTKLNEIMNQSSVGSTPHYLDMANRIAFRTIYTSFARFYARIYMFFRFSSVRARHKRINRNENENCMKRKRNV